MGTAFLAWLGALLFGTFGAAVVFALAGHDPEGPDPSLVLSLAAQIPLWALFVAIPFAVARRHRLDGALVDLRVVWQDLRFLIAGVGVQIALVPLYLPLIWLFDIDEDLLDDTARELTDRATDGLGVAIVVLFTVVAAPITEELFYRGFFQRTVVDRLGEIGGVLAASAVFAVSHFQGTAASALGIPGLLVVAIAMGFARTRTGRLAPAVLMHAGFNLTATIALLA